MTYPFADFVKSLMYDGNWFGNLFIIFFIACDTLVGKHSAFHSERNYACLLTFMTAWFLVSGMLKTLRYLDNYWDISNFPSPKPFGLKAPKKALCKG